MGVGKTVYKGEVKTGVFAWFLGCASQPMIGSPQSTVGAGLLAKAVYQATFMLTDTPSSRASPLPQVL
ncbi:hypothetical protein A1D17_13560 [Pseudomonas fluorescens]|uniref:Uncharacterized protein n=1 Tax=Pseudomonas fluorescens TaxID=294 RepID=A0A166NDH9_PSEFL|nr:hypothetical protein A1D17_13560 [Pseudomonas fluorescens]